MITWRETSQVFLTVIAAVLNLGEQAAAAPLTALTGSNQLLSYDTSNVSPGVAPIALSITGLTGGETMLGIDYRPSTGALYGVTNSSRLYTITPATGATALVGTLSTALNLGGTNSAIGFDFDPVSDQIRIIANRSGQNLSVNPANAVAVVNTSIQAYSIGDAFSGQFAQVAAVGYAPGAGVTTLFGFDDTTDRIVRIGGVNGTPSPNTGAVASVGGLGGVNGSQRAGLDVSPAGVGFLSLDVGGNVFRLFQIDLTVTNPSTNTSTMLGTFNAGGLAISDIAIVPEPATLALCCAAAAAMVLCWRASWRRQPPTLGNTGGRASTLKRLNCQEGCNPFRVGPLWTMNSR